MRGFVNRYLEPVITIEIADSDGSFQSHEVVLDTGFTGELALSYETIERLGLNYRNQAQDWTVATGEETTMNEYDGIVLWHGQNRPVVILPNHQRVSPRCFPALRQQAFHRLQERRRSADRRGLAHLDRGRTEGRVTAAFDGLYTTCWAEPTVS